MLPPLRKLDGSMTMKYLTLMETLPPYLKSPSTGCENPADFVTLKMGIRARQHSPSGDVTVMPEREKYTNPLSNKCEPCPGLRWAGHQCEDSIFHK